MVAEKGSTCQVKQFSACNVHFSGASYLAPGRAICDRCAARSWEREREAYIGRADVLSWEHTVRSMFKEDFRFF